MTHVPTTVKPRKSDMYISVDIEADGPVIPTYNIVSIGASVCGTFDGITFAAIDPAPKQTFVSEIKPVSDNWEEDALRVSTPKGMTAGAYREHLLANAGDARQVMTSFTKWVKEVCYGHKPVFVAWPMAFDWPAMYYYMETFVDDGSPFSFSSAMCIKQLYIDTCHVTMGGAGKRSMPTEFKSTLPHTHNALDDALEQGQIFAKIKAKNIIMQYFEE